jgi:SanA protein
MKMSRVKKIFFGLWILLLLVVFFIIAINFYVISFSKENYYTRIEALEPKEVWLVLWASIKSGKPSDILKDRLDVAYQAYNSWKIKKILVSWDNWKFYYNEPEVMKDYLIELWVKKEDIYLDYAWFDTYDSIYRAKDIFLLNEIVIFTQDFQLKRAMYISKKLWILTSWVETSLRLYSKARYNNFREVFARVKAFLEVEIFHSRPKYLWDTIEIISNKQVEEVKKEILEKE